jgi:HEAT repeat protein
VFALGERRSSQAIEPLSRILKNGELSLRNRAVIALGNMKDPRAVEHLAWALANVDSHKVMNNAADGLAAIGGPGAFASLLAGLKDENIYRRDACAKGLRTIIKKIPVSSIDQNVIDTIAKALLDVGRGVRKCMYDVCISLLDARLVRPLLEALKNEKNAHCIEDCLRALSSVSSFKSSDKLMYYGESRQPFRGEIIEIGSEYITVKVTVGSESETIPFKKDKIEIRN